MKTIKVKIESMANGGAGMGVDGDKRPFFIPYTIPGETVTATVTMEKKGFSRARLDEILAFSPDRVEPRCTHFGVCGGCHFQHINYEAQLKYKREVVHEQLARIGGVETDASTPLSTSVRPTVPHPSPWAYRIDVELSPIKSDSGVSSAESTSKLGFWSPSERRVIPIEHCPLIDPRLQQLWDDVDLSLPDLRKLTLRVGTDGDLLAAFEVDDVEPPDIQVDFPLSVAIVMPDKTAASLIGDHYLLQTVNDRPFRVSPGCFFHPSPVMAGKMVEAVMAYADLGDGGNVLELYSGVGMLTAFLAEKASAIATVESNPDAADDMAANLAAFDNITLYNGVVTEVLDMLDLGSPPDVVVVNPPRGGMGKTAVKLTAATHPQRIIYVSSDIATLARDAKLFDRFGFRMAEIRPFDMTPHHYQVDTVALFVRKNRKE